MVHSPAAQMAPVRLARNVLEGVQVATALALLALVAALLAGTLPSLAGYESFVVLSGSMEPALKTGDLAVVGPVRQDQLMVGDIISYRTAQRPDVVVTHRLVGIGVDERGRQTFQTKGDANDAVDQVLVEPGAVLGRVAYGIPKVGFVVEFARRPEGKLLLLGIPGLLLALEALLGVRKRRGAAADNGQAPPTAVATAAGPNAEAAELLGRGRIALANGGPGIARLMFDRAIAADPNCDDAWLLKAACLKEHHERLACLEAGLVVNPGSAQLREALAHATAANRAS